MTYEGFVLNGSLEGKKLAHWSKTYKVLRPAIVDFSLHSGGLDDAKIEPIVFETYEFNLGAWMLV